mgnify:CR=1 FL=1
MADFIDGEFRGCDVLNDDMGYAYQGVAQGGIVDTPDGDWYAVLFQDRGAVGRTPVLIPVHWENDFPVFGDNGKIPERFETVSTRPGHEYSPLIQSDDFKELIVRWFQFGLFSPVMRLHGSRNRHFEPTPGLKEPSGDPNEIWSFGEENFEILKNLIFIRFLLFHFRKFFVCFHNIIISLKHIEHCI